MANIRHILRVWVSGSFQRNVATLVSGTALAQVASIIALPLITRIYGPEAFGSLGYFSSFLSFLTPIAALCYPLALVLPRGKTEAKVIFDLSLKLAFIISFITSIVLVWVAHNFNDPIPFSKSYIFLPFGMFLSIHVMACTQWAIKLGHFRLIAVMSILSAVGAGATKIILGYYHPTATVLILISVLTLFLNSIVYSVKLNLYPNMADMFYPTKRHWFIAKKYLRFPVYRMPHALMAVVSQTAPIFLLTFFYGVEYAGFFALTRSVIAVPVTLIGKAVYDVSYPKISWRYNNRQDNSVFIIKMTVGLAILSTLPVFIMFFFGVHIFTLIFGEAWELSGIYAAWMSIWFAFNLFNKPAAAAISVYEMDRFLFWNGSLNIILSLTGFYLGIVVLKSDVAAVAMFSIFGTICQCFLIARIVHLVKSSDKLNVTRVNRSE